MIVQFKEKYKEQIWPNLDSENKKLFKNNLFIKFLFIEKNIVKGWILLQPSKDRLLLDWIFVLNKFRKQKIGTKLLTYVKKFAKNKNFRGISVNTGSQADWARSFYKKNGFKQVGSVKKFFKFDKEHIFYWFNI